MKGLSKNAGLTLAAVLVIVSCSSPKQQNAAGGDFYSSDDFNSVKKIDAHVHVNTKDSFFVKQGLDDNMNLFTINWDDINEPPPMEVQQEQALALQKTFPQQIAYATTISIKNFNDTGWLSKTIAYLDSSFAKGAKAVKIYKVIGMSLRDNQGKLVMIDDARFDTIFNYLAKRNIPVVGHLGEPRNCWLPLEQMTVKGDRSYFESYPVYHMYKHPELPSYEDQVRARDNMLAKHTDLRFVGAHLGSLEWNVDSLAARLDRFPHMAVDMAARIVHFQYQARDNWQKVHDFLVKYNDRLLYATDLMVDDSSNVVNANKSAHDTWTSDWKFFTSDEAMKSDQFDGSFKGLRLPKEVIDNIYYNNARKWLSIF